MAVIEIDMENNWVVPRWMLRYVLENFELSKVSEDFADSISKCTEQEVYYLDLENASQIDRKAFPQEVLRIMRSLKQGGPKSLSTPEVFDGLVGQIEKLILLCQTMN